MSYLNSIIAHLSGIFVQGATHKIEKIHERALRFIYNDNITEYTNLLEKANTTTQYLKRVRIIAQEVFKAINNIGPKYTKELITDRPSRYPTRRPLDIYVPNVNQVKFGYRSFRFEAPTVWNRLPNEIRTAEHFPEFKKLIKLWSGPICRCNFCKYKGSQPG